MTVKEIILQACTMLELFDVKEGIEQDNYLINTDLNNEVELLVRCYNLVVNEISTEYSPLTYTQTINNLNGVINFSSLDKNITNIIKVTDTNGNTIDYTASLDGIATKEKQVVIRYDYLAEVQTIDGSYVYEYSKITPRVVCYGMISQYYLFKRMYSEASMWQKRYQDSLQSVLTPKRLGKIKCRVWG